MWGTVRGPQDRPKHCEKESCSVGSPNVAWGFPRAVATSAAVHAAYPAVSPRDAPRAATPRRRSGRMVISLGWCLLRSTVRGRSDGIGPSEAGAIDVVAITRLIGVQAITITKPKSFRGDGTAGIHGKSTIRQNEATAFYLTIFFV